jgi:hypothetical protein
MLQSLPLADVDIGRIFTALVIIIGIVGWIFGQINDAKQKQKTRGTGGPTDLDEKIRRRQEQRRARSEKPSPAERRRRMEEMLAQQGLPPEVLGDLPKPLPARVPQTVRQTQPVRQTQRVGQSQPARTPTVITEGSIVGEGIGEGLGGEIGGRRRRSGSETADSVRKIFKNRDSFVSALVASELLNRPVGLREPGEGPGRVG